MRQLAPLFGISPATVCRVIPRLRPLPALEPAPRPVADVDRLWIVDGTLIPVRDRTVGASSRNYRFSANVRRQVRTVSGAIRSRSDTSMIEWPSAHSSTIRDR